MDQETESLHIYTRVSTQSQEEGTSLDYQKELGEKCANDFGLIPELHNEGVYSSSSENPMERPVLRKLLARIENGEIRNLFVYNQDRLSRDGIAWATIKVILMKNKVSLFTGNGVINFENPMDRLLFGVITEITSYENTLRSERTRQGKLRSLREGKIWKGGPANFGYSIKEKQLISNEDEVSWLKKIYGMYADGHAISKIRMFLVQHGVKTRRGSALWNDRSVDAILGVENNCEIYAGSYTYTDKKSGETIKCKSPQILPMKLIERVRKERAKRGEKRIKRSVAPTFYLLRDFLICDDCDSVFWGRTDRKKGEEFYHCKSSNLKYQKKYTNKITERQLNCSIGQLNAAATENIVWATIVDVLEKSHLFKEEARIQILGDNHSNTFAGQKDEVEKLRKKIERDASRVSQDKQLLSLLKRSDGNHDKTINEVDLKIKEMELRIEKDQRQVQDLDERVRWIDWLAQFGNKIETLRDVTEPKERETFLKGVITKLGVKKLDQTHRLFTLRFKYPYVNDTFTWIDRNDKSKGYDVGDGEYIKEITAKLVKIRFKKTELEIVNNFGSNPKK